jgi:transcriptional regulator with GAF, ATPase, and Fis domain
MTNHGSIFLDEIGDLELASQVKLLRVLQDRTYEVLGSSRTKTVDVRVICATNKNLEEMVAKNQFREDLLYRINLITLKLPALRERPGFDQVRVGYGFHMRLCPLHGLSPPALCVVRVPPSIATARTVEATMPRSRAIAA